MPQFKHSFRVSEVAHFAFNGDAYPVLVVQTSPCTVQARRLTSPDTNSAYGDRLVFRYSRKRDQMVLQGGAFTLHAGYAYRWNPSF